MSMERRRAMIEASHPHLSIVRQCALLQISRSGRYYQPTGEREPTLALMRLIDEAFLDCPYYGSRQMTQHLHRLGYQVGRNRVVRLMRKMGLRAIYQKPNTSAPHPEHRLLVAGFPAKRIRPKDLENVAFGSRHLSRSTVSIFWGRKWRNVRVGTRFRQN